MKILSCLCLFITMTSITQNALSQDTLIKANSPVSSNSALNSANVQSLIQANASKLQMLGISSTEAQNIANQILPQIQSGAVVINPSVISNNDNQTNYSNKNNISAFEVGDTLIEFAVQKLIESSQPNELPPPLIFGQSFFRNNNIATFNHSTDMQAPANYILGVGDQITINIWGYSSYSASYTIDQSGAILPTQTGRIYLKGMTFEDAKKIIRGRFTGVLDMANSSLDVSLIYSRVISVNIVGEVFEPGSYTMPATNTAFNALIAASGPTDIGSLRNIYIKREGQTIKTLDVYAFLLDPDSKQDFYLQNNDYIFVPTSNKIVSINGEVLRPYKFELLENENLITLLKYAGGITQKAYLNNIIIQRYEGIENKLISLNLDSLIKVKSDLKLKNGDQITINSIPELIINQIKINGPVTSPGIYSFKNGDRLSDILKKNPLRNDALTGKGYIIRTNSDLSKQYIAFSPASIIQNQNTADNILLQNEDVINFFFKSFFKDELSISVGGAVRTPGDFMFGNSMTLKDALYFAGGLKPEAANNRIEVSRIMEVKQGQDFNSIPVIIKSISINKDLSLDEASAGFQLQPFDQILVRYSSDYDLQNIVSVFGQVQYPGSYALLNKLETWTEVISRAGGLNYAAYVEDAYIFRKSNDKGLMLSHLEKALKNPKSKYNYMLKPGDEIHIPSKSNIVTITGMIRFPFIDSLQQINVPYSKGKRAKYYIKKHGLGFDQRAKRNRTYVVNPGQNVKGCKKFILFNVYPKVKNAATIVATTIPPKEYKVKNPREPINWNQTISTLTASLTGIVTVYILLNRVQ